VLRAAQLATARCEACLREGRSLAFETVLSAHPGEHFDSGQLLDRSARARTRASTRYEKRPTRGADTMLAIMTFDGRILNGIGVLAAVVESKSFVRASKALGLTPSGVSRAIGRLEERLGVRLLQRTARSVTLTDEGRRFYESVAPLMQGIEDAASEAEGSGARATGSLRVAVDSLVARVIIGPRIGAFLRAHPALDLDLVVRDQLGDLVGDGIDCAVRFGDPEPSALVAKKITDTRVVTCASRGYIEERGRPRHPRDLARHDAIQFRDPATGRPFEWIFVRRGRTFSVTPKARVIANDVTVALAACVAGVGVVQKLEMELRATPGLDLIDLFPEWNEERYPLYAYFPSRRHTPGKVRAFLDFVSAASGP
jgi:DNA-binding transcriptional LysR family regulator